MDKPAILGGKPSFEQVLPVNKPFCPDVKDIEKGFSEIFSTGQITNGKYVREFEKKIREYLGVPHAVCVSSCTLGIILTLKALGIKNGNFIVPSFTFPATVNALLWNNIEPRFVDIDPETFNISPEEVEKNIDENTKGILAVHIYGTACDVEELERIAKKYNLYLIFDSAHGFGGKYKDKFLGNFGDAEIFSLSPTKTVVAGEGGVITTKDKELAEKLRILRNYGDPGTNNFEYLGLNARMSELHAILGLYSLERVEEEIKRRNEIAEIYMENLRDIPGVSFQKVKSHIRSTYKDFSFIVDEKEFGLKRNEIKFALERENIQIKRYFYPPVHRQKFLSGEFENISLPVTEKVSESVISLPIFYSLQEKDIIRVCECVKKIYDNREQIKEYFQKEEISV